MQCALCQVAATWLKAFELPILFESKGNLYGQVVVKAFAELRAAALEGVGPNLNADTGLESLVANLVAFSQRRDSLVKVVLREIIDPSEKGTLVIQQEFASFLALVDATFRKIAGENLRQGLSTRSAIMHIVAGYLVKTAAGDLAETLWGPGEQTLEITRALLLQNA